MIDPSLPLQSAIVAALKASAAVTALVDDRIWDDVPDRPQFPYISLGPDDPMDDHDTCIGGADTTMQVNVWSRAVGRVEAKQVVAAVIAALDAPLIVTGHNVNGHRVERSFVQRDQAEPRTKHGVVVMGYLTTPST
ncbi:DUF3168 domain-containing protein [Caulobacter sp.]|uniref:DUF3168 domain-containing protein n=1 Tax=Caulobacter sp. TaxID=78 RepID=UPI003BAFAD98